MILIRKYQCMMCKHWGRVKGYDGTCCICFDDNDDITHHDRIPQRSSCWCYGQGQLDNGKKPKNSWLPFLKIGQYLTDRYGVNVRLVPPVRGNGGEWKAEIESRNLRFPITVLFSVLPQAGVYSADDMAEILKAYERKDY